MGTLPIAVGFGEGADARRPLGAAVVGGLVFSQLLTLYITPVVYTYMDSFQTRVQMRLRRKPPEIDQALPVVMPPPEPESQPRRVAS
jgi:HAE1 family hydrophobic/amphiphilic exporter-1